MQMVTRHNPTNGGSGEADQVTGGQSLMDITNLTADLHLPK